MPSRIEIEWRSGGIRCQDALHCNDASSTRLQAALSRYVESRGATSVDALRWAPERQLEVSLTDIVNPRHASFSPEAGRWYAARLLPAYPSVGAVFRVIEVGAQSLVVDLNHPLADTGAQTRIVDISALSSVASRCEPPLEEKLSVWLDAGPGLQRAPKAGPVPAFAAAVAYEREDEADDALFYAPPRLVQHIDSYARTAIANLYSERLPRGAQVLDLMSSWVTHLPVTRDDLRITGLGLNAVELSANPLLVEHTVHDLNRLPTLPYRHASFDAVICSVSVEYLRNAIDVFRSVAAVLKPGGVFVNAFSDRCFPTKAVRLWGQLHAFERMGFVADMYRQAGQFEAVHTWSETAAPRPADDDYALQMNDADPVFAVWATRRR